MELLLRLRLEALAGMAFKAALAMRAAMFIRRRSWRALGRPMRFEGRLRSAMVRELKGINHL